MTINWRSLQKLLRDNISGNHPLEVSPEQAQDLIEDLLTQVESLPGAERNDDCFQIRRQSQGVPKGPDAPDPLPADTVCCCVLLEEDASNRWYHNHTHLHLVRSPDQKLWVDLGGNRSEASISNIEEVIALVRAFHQRVQQRKAKAAKRQKQRDLKLQAILAQVRKIAKEDKFDFATDVDSVKLKLIIRLSDNDFFVILIPFNRFKEGITQIAHSDSGPPRNLQQRRSL